MQAISMQKPFSREIEMFLSYLFSFRFDMEILDFLPHQNHKSTLEHVFMSHQDHTHSKRWWLFGDILYLTGYSHRPLYFIAAFDTVPHEHELYIQNIQGLHLWQMFHRLGVIELDAGCGLMSTMRYGTRHGPWYCCSIAVTTVPFRRSTISSTIFWFIFCLVVVC